MIFTTVLFCPPGRPSVSTQVDLLAAACMERIGGDIDVCAVVILEVEPSHIAWRENLFERDDTLLRAGRIFPANQERNRFAGSETAGKKVGGDLIHMLTSQERNSTGRFQ